jgi:hypothetical protein
MDYSAFDNSDPSTVFVLDKHPLTIGILGKASLKSMFVITPSNIQDDSIVNGGIAIL